ncbi:DMT family transporter [Microvirga lenta]|uniref:DMT family transporter n=1 Tax=Microvirga lenta TaxID=2881337 RepID=UPI001CFF715C|nr:DMT family transporter [Microvirga lenta]MCB5174997.1 DMT family transporter [Microvirga lenta]
MTSSIASKLAAPAPSAGAQPHHRPVESQLRGTLLMVGSTVFFSVSDVITKELASSLPPVEIAWLRYATFALLVIPALLMNGGGTILRSQRPGLQVLRGLGMVGSSLLFTAGLPFLPVADATAIYFISPILIMALSVLFLGEDVGWRRWSAAAVGLLGVVIVIRPGTSAFEAAAFLPLLGATSWAASAVVTRKMSGRDHPLTTLAYSAFVGLVVLSIALPFTWVAPSWEQVAFGLCIGILSTAGHWLVILAYRHANASVIAPFSYVQLLWASALGYLVFSTLPDMWTALGASIIAASGLYTAYRERVRALERKRAEQGHGAAS